MPQTPAQTLEAIAEFTSRRALAEGMRIFAGRGVTATGRNLYDDEFELRFDVDDHVVQVYTHARTHEVTYAECDCTADGDCEHVAAALLRVSGLPAGTRVEAPAAWERELSGLFGRDGEADKATAEACLFLRIEAGRASQFRLAARPGVRGARGTWIKGNINWHRVEALPGAFGEILGELRDASHEYDSWRYYRSDDWLPLTDISWRRLWPTLIEARDAGLAIVADGKSQRPVQFADEPLGAEISIGRHGSGLRVRATLAPAVSSEWAWVGDPAVAVAAVAGRGTADEVITLHPLEKPLDGVVRGLIDRQAALQIDASGRTRFEREFLPRLQQRTRVVSSGDGYDVPPPPRPVLTLAIAYGENQTHVTWAWDRRPTGLGDAEFEASVIAAVRSAYAEHPELFGDGPVPASRTYGLASAALFGAEILPRLRDVDGLRITEGADAPAYRPASGSPLVSITAEGDSIDWFDLSVVVTVDGEDVEFARLFTALAVGDPVMVLPSGTFFPLDAPELQQLRRLIDEARALGDRSSSGIRISRYQVDLWEELRELGVVAAQKSAWVETVRALSRAEMLTQVEPPAALQATMRDYQQAGYSWLDFLRRNGLGGVLADDMGLGKTLQTIAMIAKAREDAAGSPPFLIVAPTSVVSNWASEFARFAPALRVVTITATQRRRGSVLSDAVGGAEVVITSYALFRLEFDDYERLDWAALVLDEAQMIKNSASAGYACARKLGAPCTFVITGTPLENHLLELWALVSLSCPGLLGGRESFTEYYRVPIEREQNAERLATLQRRLRPFLLRRTKELVASELPARQEQVQHIALHTAHRAVYDRRLARERQKVLGLIDDVAANRFEIFRSLTMLRQLALDTELTDDGAAPSAKLDALGELLAEIVDEGHKVLVFSQFTRFLGKARDRAVDAGMRHAYLDGRTTNRAHVIDGFRNGGADVFFISLKSGGFGLNLVEADYVVLLDPWWNPATEQQAIDRVHRIGQERPVFVYRLIAADTIESKVMTLKASKSDLFTRVLDGGELGESRALTAGDIASLLE